MLLVYAFVEWNGEPPDLGVGINGEVLRDLVLAGVHVVVGEIEAVETDISNAVAYDGVIRRLQNNAAAIVPSRFNSTAADEQSLERIVADGKEAITNALERVRDRVQMTLRLSGRASAVPSDVQSATTAAAGPGTSYLAKLLEEKRRANAVPELDGVRPDLAALLRGEKTERHDRPPWFASVYHLVEKDQADAYREVITRSAASLEGVGVLVSVGGPFPPYAFAPGAVT